MREKEPIPSSVQRVLGWFLRDELLDEVNGDFQQLYDALRETRPRFIATMIIWYEVMHYLRPFAIRKNSYRYINPYPMYNSYFKTAFRSMTKNKLHTFINIAGLSVGMAVTIVISLWIVDEVTFDRNFESYSRVGQVLQHVTNNGEVQTWNAVPYPLAEELRKNYGGDFKYVVLSRGQSSHLVSTESKKLYKDGLFAEPDFTKMFQLQMISGTSDAIKDPSSLLISASAAKSFFGEADPIGQTLTIDQGIQGKVAGIYDDIKENSTFANLQFIGAWDLLYNHEAWMKNMDDPWRPNAFTVYVELNDNASFDAASARIRDAKLKKVNETLAKKKPALFIHPMRDWHLRASFKNGKNAGGRIEYVWLFGIAGGFVLLMACINFMNLSTARSEKRAKEVGIRKAIGSFRGQLIAQFFSESVLVAMCSLGLALLVAQVMLPLFNQLAGKNVSMEWGNPTWWLIGIMFSIFIGLIAGSYPALYLSSIKSVTAIKGAFKAGRAAALPRKILVTIQFSVSVVLIIGTAVVFMQVQHAKNRAIGYETNGLVAVPLLTSNLHDHFDAAKRQLEEAGAITGMAEAVSMTTDQYSSSSQFDWTGKDPDMSVDFPNYGVSHDYGKTIGWEIKEGRDFSRDYISDSSALIVNEAAVKYMGLKNPVGETIRWSGQAFQIVGVVSDIVVRSPYEPISPTVYYLSTWSDNFLILRINPETSATAALQKIEEVYKQYAADMPFSYQFMDEAYAKKFGNEERIGTLATIFSVIAILISCLGIFGLSSFMAEQRTKELGVRKVMGASRFELWRLMSRDFVLLVVLSCFIAGPIAYMILSSWLEHFTYRLGIPWWTFVAASVGTLVITLITVSWHTLSAAGMSPVKSLRSE